MPIIYDEVFCGLWRLGVESTRELLGEDPDVSCYAKLLTGGLVPMSATVATERVFEAFSGAKVCARGSGNVAASGSRLESATAAAAGRERQRERPQYTISYTLDRQPLFRRRIRGNCKLFALTRVVL